MNVLYVTGHPSDAQFMEHELCKSAPHIHVEVSPNCNDALMRVVTPGHYDALLLDPTVLNESLSLIGCIRNSNLPMAIIALTNPTGEEPPLKILVAGADDYVVRRPSYMKSLPLALERWVDRRKIEVDSNFQPVAVLHTGDMEQARRCFIRPHQFKLEAAPIGPDGCCQIAASPSDKFPYDVVILDDETPALNMLRALKEILSRAHDTPVILLIKPESEELGAQGIKMGAIAYILKSGNYYRCLVQALENSVFRRDLLRDRAALQATESRLRMLIETIPACVTLVTRDGTIQAMNWAGPSTVGAIRVDEVVGKNLCSLAVPRYRDALKSVLGRVCAGERAEIDFEWHGFDGVRRHLQLRAVPLRRESENDISALVVIQDSSQQRPPKPANELLGETSDATVPETMYRETEQQNAMLAEALQVAKDECVRLEEKQRTDYAQWDEERVAFLTTARAASARYAQSQQLQRDEQAKCQATHQEMEWQRTALEEALRAAEIENSHLATTHGNQQADLEKRRQESEQLCRELQERYAELEQQNLADRAAWDSTRLRLEEQVRMAESNLTEAESRHASVHRLVVAMEMQHGEVERARHDERIEWEATRQRLEQQYRTLDEQKAVLEETVRGLQARLDEIEGQQHAERAAWDATRHGLGQHYRAVEEQRTALEEALRSSQERLVQVAAGHKAERAELEALRQELQGQRATRLALEGALRAAESRQGPAPDTKPATAALQTLAELIQPMRDLGRLLLECLGSDDAQRLPSESLIEIADYVANLAQRLLNFVPVPETADQNDAVVGITGTLPGRAGENTELSPYPKPEGYPQRSDQNSGFRLNEADHDKLRPQAEKNHAAHLATVQNW
jgi:PAS domain S-box-containing protein